MKHKGRYAAGAKKVDVKIKEYVPLSSNAVKMSVLIQLNYLIFVFITFSLPQYKGLSVFLLLFRIGVRLFDLVH